MRHTREADSQKLEVFSLAPAQHLRVISAAQMPGDRASGGTPAVQNQPRTFAERAERFTGCHEQEIKKRGRFRQSHNTVQVSAAIRINPSTLLAPKTAFRVHEAPSFLWMLLWIPFFSQTFRTRSVQTCLAPPPLPCFYIFYKRED